MTHLFLAAEQERKQRLIKRPKLIQRLWWRYRLWQINRARRGRS